MTIGKLNVVIPLTGGPGCAGSREFKRRPAAA